MKRILLIAMCCIIIFFTFAGCTKCIKSETYTEKVKIVDTYYKASWIQPVYIGNTMTMIPHSPEYRVVISYKNSNYTFDNIKYYDAYNNHKCKYANAIIKKKTYDNGTVECFVSSLK